MVLIISWVGDTLLLTSIVEINAKDWTMYGQVSTNHNTPSLNQWLAGWYSGQIFWADNFHNIQCIFMDNEKNHVTIELFWENSIAQIALFSLWLVTAQVTHMTSQISSDSYQISQFRVQDCKYPIITWMTYVVNIISCLFSVQNQNRISVFRVKHFQQFQRL